VRASADTNSKLLQAVLLSMNICIYNNNYIYEGCLREGTVHNYTELLQDLSIVHKKL